ncbi:MAG: hypothetical protein HC840_32680, partial [Leptolyngbyaceae cyanobacterium RM2_2_4]|nr:hypothetical protein [Leptolyngbyaceae cyanobacterium RM2_2_4]
ERWRQSPDTEFTGYSGISLCPEMAMLGYARTTTGHMPLQDIRDCISEADRNPGKWRSDSGDVEADFIWELRRWQLLRGQSSDIQEVRRCFLFESVYEKLLQINTGALYTDCELMP